MAVLNHVEMMARASSALTSVAPSASTFAPLCSTKYRARVIAGDGHRPNVGPRRQRRLVGGRASLVDDGHAAFLQRVLGKRRDVPAARERHRLAAQQNAGIALGDDIEAFHWEYHV